MASRTVQRSAQEGRAAAHWLGGNIKTKLRDCPSPLAPTGRRGAIQQLFFLKPAHLPASPSGSLRSVIAGNGLLGAIIHL